MVNITNIFHSGCIQIIMSFTNYLNIWMTRSHHQVSHKNTWSSKYGINMEAEDL